MQVPTTPRRRCGWLRACLSPHHPRDPSSMIDHSLLPSVLLGDRLAGVTRYLERFPDSRQVAIRLSRVLAAEETVAWANRHLFDASQPLPLFDSLCQTLAQSEFLTRIVERDPELLTSFESDEEFGFSSGPSVFERELFRHLEQIEEGDRYRIALARFRLHEIFRIAVRDITGRAPIETLARELSDLADFVLQAAYERAYAVTLMSFGAPRLADGRLAEMAVIGLGKHGSRELNFSSDLDLILLYEGNGKTDLDGRAQAYEDWLAKHPYARFVSDPPPLARTRAVSFEAFFAELGTRVIEMVSEPGPLGGIYRIDMRLRPEGESGPLVRDLESALSYYENWGERWERQALIRARHCAGSESLSQRFKNGVEDFIYRKYVDPVEVEETLAGIRSLRSRAIRLSGRNRDERRRNLKNGPGGIRDIEFLVQAVQILYGGQFPELREGSTFEILRRIHQSGLMGARDFQVLSIGYDFLRRLEHRIQMDDIQKYHLPNDSLHLENLARGLGIPDGRSLERGLFETLEEIHSVFKVVFRAEESEKAIGDVLDRPELTESWRETILGYGLPDPDSVFRSLGRLAVDPESPHLNSKLRRLLKAVLPRLFSLVRETPRPDWAWKAFANIGLATPARSTFFSVVGENPRLLELLVNLGSTSSHLAEILCSNPRLIDDLVDRATFERAFDADRLESDFQNQEGSQRGGDVLQRVRAFRTRAETHITGRFALGFSRVSEAVTEFSDLAEFCLVKCIDETWSQGALGMAVFGFGKLGGRELGFRSDLDLIVLYDARLQAKAEVPIRLSARLVNELGVHAPEGRLFEADLRLRPHGKNSPLTTSFEAALAYYRNEGQTWERLALTRCRPIWGEGVVIGDMHRRLKEWVFAESANAEMLQQIREMRYRIQREKPKQALKAGPGGLLDVEFIAQTGQLRWGAADPSLRSSNTCDSVDRFTRMGLIPETVGRTLCHSYLFLREIENRLSLLGKPGANGLPEDEESLEHLVGCLNHAAKRRTQGEDRKPWTCDSLVEAEGNARGRVREIFEELFEKGFIAAPVS